jgi:hypothetical protein
MPGQQVVTGEPQPCGISTVEVSQIEKFRETGSKNKNYGDFLMEEEFQDLIIQVNALYKLRWPHGKGELYRLSNITWEDDEHPSLPVVVAARMTLEFKSIDREIIEHDPSRRMNLRGPENE